MADDKGSKRSTKGDKGDAEAANARVQAQVDAENEQGYVGVVPDGLPNEAYTLEGVTSGEYDHLNTRDTFTRQDQPVLPVATNAGEKIERDNAE